MPDRTHIVNITILDKKYRIHCPENEQDDLQLSAKTLDKQMRNIRDNGKVIGVERIAVMAALNLSSELQLARQNQMQSAPVAARLEKMRYKIKNILKN